MPVAMEAQPPRQARAVERRETLLRTATRVFAQRGYSAAGMDEIASAAETSKGGLYFHFPTKQALLSAVVARVGGLLQRRIREAMDAAGDDPVERAEAALSALFDALAGRRALARVLHEAIAAGPAVRAQVAELEDGFAAILRAELEAALAQDRIAPLDADLTARAWIAMAQGLIGAWAAGRAACPPEQIHTALRQLALRSAGIETTATSSSKEAS